MPRADIAGKVHMGEIDASRRAALKSSRTLASGAPGPTGGLEAARSGLEWASMPEAPAGRWITMAGFPDVDGVERAIAALERLDFSPERFCVVARAWRISVLATALRKRRNYILHEQLSRAETVGRIDLAIGPDRLSGEDRALVAAPASFHGMDFMVERGELGLLAGLDTRLAVGDIMLLVESHSPEELRVSTRVLLQHSPDRVRMRENQTRRCRSTVAAGGAADGLQ